MPHRPFSKHRTIVRTANITKREYQPSLSLATTVSYPLTSDLRCPWNAVHGPSSSRDHTAMQADPASRARRKSCCLGNNIVLPPGAVFEDRSKRRGYWIRSAQQVSSRTGTERECVKNIAASEENILQVSRESVDCEVEYSSLTTS